MGPTSSALHDHESPRRRGQATWPLGPEAAAGSPVEIRLRKNGRHATFIWAITPKRDTHLKVRKRLYAPAMGDLVRGTGWPGAGRATALELDFNDVADVDGLRMFVQRAGFAVHERTDKSWLIGLGNFPAKPRHLPQLSRRQPARFRTWSRLGCCDILTSCGRRSTPTRQHRSSPRTSPRYGSFHLASPSPTSPRPGQCLWVVGTPGRCRPDEEFLAL